MTISKTENHYIFAASLSDIEAAGGCLSVLIGKHTIAIFYYNSKVYAVDNRCPHMGFPLNRGTVKDGILTCHWHHARFDLLSGGAFDLWAGDVSSFPVEIRNRNEVWIDVSSCSIDPISSSLHQMMLQNGLKQNMSLMIAKAVIAILGEAGKFGNDKNDKNDKNDDDDDASSLLNVFRTGLDFGTGYKQSGWGQGLTMLTCMMNILPYLKLEDKAYALYHGLSAVAQDCASMPPRFEISPLPLPWADLSTLKSWFRQFIESRDAQAADRCIITAIRAGANIQQMADMLFAAATDHRYLDVGHVLDFTNKALEALDIAGWDEKLAESVLSSLVSGYANAARMEESSSWRYPIDLITILENAFKELPIVLENGRRIRRNIKATEKDNRQKQQRRNDNNSNHRDALIRVLLGDDPRLIVRMLLDTLNQGATEEELASAVSYAAALRIAQFNTHNEFTDWDTTLHTFTFANAVHQGLRRIATPELLRAVFDAAMRVYLNRFLNIPPTSLPKPISNNYGTDSSTSSSANSPSNDNNKNNSNYPEMLLKKLPELFDKQQQVNQAGQLVSDYLYNDGNPDRLLTALGNILLREDRNFHSIQMVEAAFRQYVILSAQDTAPVPAHTTAEKMNVLIAAARYLAAHSPTMRSQGQTYRIANQLYHGERLFEEQ